MEKYIQLYKQEDFLRYVGSPFSTSFVTDAATIPAGSCSFNTSTEAFRINDGSASTKGVLNIPIGFVNVGDKVEIEVEFLNVSGVKAKIAIDFYDNVGYTVLNSNGLTYQSDGGNQYVKNTISFLSTKAKYAMLLLGVFTADVGDFYVRHVKIKIITSDTSNHFKDARRLYVIKGASSGFSLVAGYSEDACTLSIDSVAKELTITHGKPFSHTIKSGSASVNVSATSEFKYLARSKSEAINTLKIKFYDMDTKTVVDPATLAADTNFWFNVVHFGYDLI